MKGGIITGRSGGSGGKKVENGGVDGGGMKRTEMGRMTMMAKEGGLGIIDEDDGGRDAVVEIWEENRKMEIDGGIS